MKLGNLLSLVVSYSELRISFSNSEVKDSEFTKSKVHLSRSELVRGKILEFGSNVPFELKLRTC